MTLEDRKILVRDWFAELRRHLCAAFEALEDAADPLIYGNMETRARFCHTSWQRAKAGEPDQGGGTMGMLRGPVFEKAGIHFSEVHGEFSEAFRHQIPGASEDPRFWACGVSLIAHPRNPLLPAAHMNTRMIVTTESWFGGGGDLNPMLSRFRTDDHPDTIQFHASMKAACDAHDAAYYPRFKKWCDEYFHLPHRNEPRGVGGIFYDRLQSGDWDADFAFTQDVGRAFLSVYPQILHERLNAPWADEDRAAQAAQRGRYAEFNLLYDRGTTFGLKTGGNVESILSSLPPMATWA